ncbi:MAG: TetR/AcrR family transcriptional regulator [Enterococcus sp.]
MRRKVYTKEQILKAAYEVISKEGFSGFTARNIAKKMGISTQPIYLEFKNMDDLKNTLLDSIFDKLRNDIFPVEHTGDSVVDLNLNYINFAKKQHQLYMALYIDEHGGGQRMRDFSYDYFTNLIKTDEAYAELTSKQIEALFNGLWIVSTGLASLMTSGIMHPTEDQIIDLIKQTKKMILELDHFEGIN